MPEYSQPRCAAASIAVQKLSQPRETASRNQVSISFALVLVFIVALYSQLPLQVPALGVAGGMNLLGGLAIAAVVFQRLLNRDGFELLWPESYLLLAFVGAAALSCVDALWPRYSLENTVNLLKFTAVYFLIVHTVDNLQRLRSITWTLVLGGVFPSLGTLSNYLHGRLEEGRATWIGIFGNPNEVAYSLIVLLPLGVYLAGTSRGWRRGLLWVILGTNIAAIAVTYSRGGVLGLVAVAVLLAWRWRQPMVLLLAAVLVIGCVAFLLYGWTRSESFNGLGSDLNLQQRLVTFQGGFAMFLEHPLTGIGVGCSLIAWPLYAPGGLYTRSWLVIHNMFVQALSETGLLGFSSFMLLLGAAILRSRRMARENAGPNAAQVIPRFGAAVEVSLWGLIICGMSGGYVLTWFPYILLALVSAGAVVSRQLGRGGVCDAIA
jgi:O-antigen ligase